MMLYIVRHGETDWNRMKKVQGHTDIPLNDYGRHLAEETAEGMKEIRLDLGFTSPLKRARETAEIILAGRNIPLIDEERIKEIGFGRYEGMFSGGENRRAMRSTAFSRIPEITFHRKTPRLFRNSTRGQVHFLKSCAPGKILQERIFWFPLTEPL